MLPKPDAKGHYWLTSNALGPAIFRAQGDPRQAGKYIASLGHDMLWAGNEFRYFDTPGEAMQALRKAGVRA